MARRNVYICDGADCGAVLVRPEDGFLIQGPIKTTSIDGEAKTLVEPKYLTGTLASEGPPSETALCKECLLKALNLPHT
jgi:hypothetical protein